MQLARLHYHLNTRTPWGKLCQIVAAIHLECHCSKHEILEAYLNLAPYGRNIEGVGAASLIYFGREPSQLTPGRGDDAGRDSAKSRAARARHRRA